MTISLPVRRRRAAPSLVALAVLAALVGACGSTAPSAAPTEPPVVDGSPAASLGLTSDLAAFDGHLREITAVEGRIIQALGAAGAGSALDMQRVVAEMRAWADDGRTWLAANPPDACYDAAGTKYEAALTAMTDAADKFEALAAASPLPADGGPESSAAVEALQNVSRSLLDSASSAKVNRPNCR